MSLDNWQFIEVNLPDAACPVKHLSHHLLGCSEQRSYQWAILHLLLRLVAPTGHQVFQSIFHNMVLSLVCRVLTTTYVRA